MPALYKIDKQRKLVMSTAAGMVSVAEALAHQEKLSKDPDFDPASLSYWTRPRSGSGLLILREHAGWQNGPFSPRTPAAPSW
jgi:hypothetical protein